MNSRKRAPFSFKLPEYVFVILILFSGVMLTFSSGSFVVNFQRVGFTIVSTMQKGVHAVSNTVTKSVTAVKEMTKLRQEYLALTEKLKDYEYLQHNNAEIRKENERLKEQLGFVNQLTQKNYPAMIIGRDPNNTYSGITINKGTAAGIRKNMPVIAVQNGNVGLVGKVVSVGYGTSMIMPVYDLQCSVSARIQNTRDIGLVTGMGDADNPLTMKYIKKRVMDELQFGDVVVTSGESQNYMRDIPIGTISKIKVLDYDSSLDIELKPSVDFSRLETVIVVDLGTPEMQQVQPDDNTVSTVDAATSSPAASPAVPQNTTIQRIQHEPQQMPSAAHAASAPAGTARTTTSAAPAAVRPAAVTPPAAVSVPAVPAAAAQVNVNTVNTVQTPANTQPVPAATAAPSVQTSQPSAAPVTVTATTPAANAVPVTNAAAEEN